MTTPWPAEARYLQLDDVVVDLRLRRLVLAGRSAELPQRVFDLMLLFLSEPHRLHTRAALFERLWGGTVVEDTNLSQSVWLLRKALGEGRKAWVRTVAKSGYVFEPPAAVLWFERLPSSPVEAEARATTDATSSPAPRGAPGPTAAGSMRRTRPQRRKSGAWLVAAALALAALATAWAWRAKQAGASRSVALVVMHDGTGASSWPASLLQQWLRWKLDSLPEVNLLGDGEVARAGGAPVDVVFLSSVRAGGDADRLELHARLIRDGHEERLDGVAAAADMPALVDTLSHRIVARLLPRRAAPWPRLELGADAAQRYEGFARALDRRDWMTTARLGPDVLRRAPRFALAHLQLADALRQLGQTETATEHERIAAELLQAAPADALASLAARRQTTGADADRAANFYAGLIERYPDKTGYRLELARLLIQAGQDERALAQLRDAPGRGDGLGASIAKRLLRAQAYGNLGDPARMRAASMQAQRLAADAGAGWDSEQASAWLLRGRAERFQRPERRQNDEFERAAALYRRMGDATGELYADYLARMAGGADAGAEADAALDVLLARASVGGHRRLEVMILLTAADHRSKLGDADGYRSRLDQAAAVAAASGDPVLIGQTQMRRMNVEILQARFDRAAAIAQRLQRLDLRGITRLFVDQNSAALAMIQGDSRRALALMDATERLLPPRGAGQRESEASAQIACVRADLLSTLGRLREARATLQRCRQGERWALRFYAPALGSHLEWLAGDLPQAKALLAQAQAATSTMAPDGWLNAIEVARLSTRLGEFERSQRLYAQVLAPVRANGYAFLTALTLTGMAENAAARDDRAGAREFAVQARRALADGAWAVASRLDLLAVFDAQQRGDRAAADALAARLHRRARALGDVVVELQLHQLLGPESRDAGCGPAEREALIARTAMRGARLDWLLHADDGRRSAQGR